MRYLIGDFGIDPEVTPAALAAAVSGLSHAQRGTAYREGGWTLRHMVHHLAHAHLSGYSRYRQ